MKIFIEEAEEKNLNLGILNNVLKMYQKLDDDDEMGDLGTQALIKYYD